MTYVPKINLPAEGVEHARWLEVRSLDAEQEITQLRRDLESALKQLATIASQLGSGSSGAGGAGGDGLPPGGRTGQTVRKTSPAEGAARWTYEWQGLMPEYWISLDPAGATYWASGIDGDTEADEQTAKRLLPPVQFDDGGLTLLPIFLSTYQDGPAYSGAQSPIHLGIEVWPAVEGQEFTIHLPRPDHVTGVVTPFYTFQLTNMGDVGAVVNIVGTNLFYEGTLTPVLGDTNVWSLASGFQGAWFVRHVKGWGAVAAPSILWDGTTATFSDEYYETNVYTP